MVAIASNTSETSTWDTLNGFLKLHSRAREAKTNRYAEATGCKPLTRVEIQQVIYDSRIRLESFSRDPIGFKGGINLYQFCRSRSLSTVDPSGLFGYTPPVGVPIWPQSTFWPPPPGAAGPENQPHAYPHSENNKRCIFNMSGSPFPTEVPIPTNGGGVFNNVSSASEIASAIRDTGCCEIQIRGHQGGNHGNSGGATAYPGGYPNQPRVRILPDGSKEIGDALRAAGCGVCSIFNYTCGGEYGDQDRDDTRAKIAVETGCDVFGVKERYSYEDCGLDGDGSRYVNSCDPKKWGKKRCPVCKGSIVPWPLYRYPAPSF